jgi:hypothetical protein
LARLEIDWADFTDSKKFAVTWLNRIYSLEAALPAVRANSFGALLAEILSGGQRPPLNEIGALKKIYRAMKARDHSN